MSDYLEVWGAQTPTLVPLGELQLVGLGRSPSNQVPLPDDTEVSRMHAVLERLPAGWCVRDLSSRNGTFVNGERIVSDRPLHHRDEVRVGQTRVVLCVASADGDVGPTTAADQPPALTKRETDVLHALFSPARNGDVFTEPASTRQMAAELFVSEAAIKQHLAHLYDKFGILDGDRRRVRLANEAIRRGAIRLPDVRNPLT
jgi:ATP/maltotriose-dependent transcriptional regulator MalT